MHKWNMCVNDLLFLLCFFLKKKLLSILKNVQFIFNFVTIFEACEVETLQSWLSLLIYEKYSERIQQSNAVLMLLICK